MNTAQIRQKPFSSSGQSLVEFAMVLPLILVVVMGVIEVGYALLDQHGVTKLTREGSNMISRDSSLDDAFKALASMATRSLDFNKNATVIFTVVKVGTTSGSTNFGKQIIYQRMQKGTVAAASAVTSTGGSFGGGPDYQAANPDTDPSLQVTSLPASLVGAGDFYVTEVFANHPLITPFDRLGITLPKTLYSIAYF
jgi:Flp pilus assembly protein TadG